MQRTAGARSTASERSMAATKGLSATSMLSRIPIEAHELIKLPRLRADLASRSAIVARLALDTREPVTVIGVLYYQAPPFFNSFF